MISFREKLVTNERTNGRTNGRTDERTFVLLELLSQLKSWIKWIWVFWFSSIQGSNFNLRFLTTQEDDKIPTYIVDTRESYNSIWGKTKIGFRKVQQVIIKQNIRGRLLTRSCLFFKGGFPPHFLYHTELGHKIWDCLIYGRWWGDKPEQG